MNDVLRELHRKMDEIIGRQERSLSVLTAIQVNAWACCEQTHPHSVRSWIGDVRTWAVVELLPVLTGSSSPLLKYGQLMFWKSPLYKTWNYVNHQNTGAGGRAPAAPAVGGGQVPPVDTIRRDEVNAVLANQRELVSATRDIKNFVTDVHRWIVVPITVDSTFYCRIYRSLE